MYMYTLGSPPPYNLWMWICVSPFHLLVALSWPRRHVAVLYRESVGTIMENGVSMYIVYRRVNNFLSHRGNWAYICTWICVSVFSFVSSTLQTCCSIRESIDTLRRLAPPRSLNIRMNNLLLQRKLIAYAHEYEFLPFGWWQLARQKHLLPIVHSQLTPEEGGYYIFRCDITWPRA